MIHKKMKMCLRRVYMRAYSLFHPIEKKILFESFGGKQYSDNPRAISEKLHELYPEYEIVWRLRTKENPYSLIPSYVRTIHTPLEFMHEYVTSFCYVTNDANEPDKIKRSKQMIVQTWHGDRGFKKVLYEVCEGGKSPVPIVDNKITDVCISGSSFGEQTYKNAFRFNGTILNVGSARNDRLVFENTANILHIKESLHIPKDVKIVLYAPTFRDSGTRFEEYKVDIARTIAILEKSGEQWICLLRFHPKYHENIEINSQKIIDVSLYPDMADLLQIADLLITDYSSSACDFIIKNKPIVLAAYDKKNYIANSRQLKVGIDEPGFFVAESQEELEYYLSTLSEIDYIQSCDAVKKFYGINETGYASEKICHMIHSRYCELFGNTI